MSSKHKNLKLSWVAAGAAAALTIGLASVAAASETSTRKVVDTAAVARHLERVMDSLAAIEAKLKKPRKIRAEADMARSEIEAALDALRRAEPAPVKAEVLKRAPATAPSSTLMYRKGDRIAPVRGDAPAGAVVLKPMSAKGFKALLRKLSESEALAKRHDVLERAVRKYYFTSAQTEKVIRSFDFDRDRVKAAALLYGSTADPENYERVVDAVESTKARKALLKRIGLES